MKHEIKINKLFGWTLLIENVLRTVAAFNSGLEKTSLDAIVLAVNYYDIHYGHGIFVYTTRRPSPDILEIYIDDELALSLTMCEVHELINY